jgi:hypothetical protein
MKQDRIEYDRKYRATHREQCRESARKSAARNADRVKRYREQNKEKIDSQQKLWRTMLKVKALDIVGHNKIQCSNCGCTRIEILEINHKNGNGGVERKELGGGSRFHNSIVKGRRDVGDLNILCRVCNAAHYVKMKYGINFEVKPI